MPGILGVNGKMYYQDTGERAAWPVTGPAPDLEELLFVGEVDFAQSRAEASVTTRGNAGWKATMGALLDVAVSFNLIYDPTDAGYEALRDAFYGGTSIAIAALDGDSATAGTEGVWADWAVTQFNISQGDEVAMVVAVTIKPTLSAVPPEVVVVAAAA